MYGIICLVHLPLPLTESTSLDTLGQLAALGTAFSFAITSTMFTLSGREVGSPLINRARLLVGILLTLALHWILMGNPFPANVGTERWFWLGLSGFIGLALGDAVLFQAFIIIGPRLSMLLMSFAPVLSVFIAWIALNETLSAIELVGIAMIIGGIVFVVLERGDTRLNLTRRQYIIGILFGLGGAAGQAVGSVLTKVGLEGDFPALSGNVIRLGVAMLAIWGFTILRGEVASSFQRLRANPRATRFMIGGAITGPFIGVWLSLVAVQKTDVGIASALMGLTPIFLLPITYFVFNEKISRQAIIGTVVAVLGTIVLFL